MKKLIFGLFLLLVLAACTTNKQVSSEQSIQEIVGNTTYQNVQVQENASQPESVINENTETNETSAAETSEIISSESPVINKKCRNSVIIYGGCKWTSDDHVTFDLKIGNSGNIVIPGAWLFITGDSGTVKMIKRTESIIPGMTVTYNLNNKDLASQIGRITRVEVLPIEVINSTEYACENQRVYTIPDTYCKNSQPINIDNMTNG